MIFRMNRITLLPAIFTLVVVSAAMSVDFGWGDWDRFTVDTRDPVAPGYFNFTWSDSEPFTISSPTGLAFADSGAFRLNTLGPIPTASAWGMIAMALLVLTAGSVVLTRRRAMGAG